MEVSANSGPVVQRNLPSLRTIVIALLFVIGASFPMLLVSIGQDETGLYRLGLIAMIQLTPFLVCTIRKKFNFLAFILVSHCFTYTLGKLKSYYDLGGFFTNATVAELNQIIICNLIELGVFLIVRYIIMRNLSNSKPSVFTALSNRAMAISFLFSMALAFASDYLPPQFGTLVPVATYLNLAYIFASTAKNQTYLSLAKMGLAFAGGLGFLIGGGLTGAASVMFVCFICSSLQGIKVTDGIFVTLICFCIFAIQPIKGFFRNLGQASSVSFLDRITLTKDLLVLAYSPDSELSDEDKAHFFSTTSAEAISDSIHSTGGNPEGVVNEDAPKASTISLLLEGYDRLVDSSLERVLIMTPTQIPFWGGSTYTNMIYMFIPRFFWPEKPSYGAQLQKFGHVYHYTLDDDWQTSIAFSYLAEGYMNFGFAGLYGTAALFACMACVMEAISIAFLNGPNCLSTTIFLLPLLSYSSDTTSMINTCFIITVLCWLVRPLLVRTSKYDAFTD